MSIVSFEKKNLRIFFITRDKFELYKFQILVRNIRKNRIIYAIQYVSKPAFAVVMKRKKTCVRLTYDSYDVVGFHFIRFVFFYKSGGECKVTIRAQRFL